MASAVKYTQGSETVVTDPDDIKAPLSPEPSSNGLSPAHTRPDEIFCRSRIWMILAITFVVISVVLFVSLVVRESQQTSSPDCRPAYTAEALIRPSHKEIIARFRSYFRTLEEQRMVEERLRKVILNKNITKAPTDDTHTPLNCTFRCADQSDLQDRLSEGQPSSLLPSIYNGCCISTPVYVKPDNATIVGGEFVTVVQLEMMKQYFPYEHCRQAKLCIGCTCGHQKTFTSAVVSFNDTVAVKLIQIEGCCKCYNNL